MAEQKIGETPTAPVWLDPVIPKSRGLDLLGLRAPVQFVGNRMMNGITTITPAVRYLSLRAWLLRTYAEAQGLDEWRSFHDWSANAEAAIAIGNRVAETHALGIVGAGEAANLSDGAGESIDLKALVRQLAISIYANPSRELGISYERSSGIHGLSEERGILLASAAEEQLRTSSIAVQLKNNQPLERASVRDLKEFGKLSALNDIPDQECLGLIDAVMPPEPGPQEKNRVASFSLILALAESLKRTPTEDDIFKSVTSYESTVPHQLDFIRDGWLAYLARDVVAVCHEGAFACIVEALEITQSERGASVLKDDVIEAALRRAVLNSDLLTRVGIELPHNQIDQLKYGDLLNQLLSKERLSSKSDTLLARWANGPSERATASLAEASGGDASVLLPFSWALVYFRALADQQTTDQLSPLFSRQGWARIGLAEVIKPEVERFVEEDWTYMEVLRELFQRTVDQHLRIAWTRLRFEREPKDVAVITSDGRRWSSRRDFMPGRSASRLDQAISWLQQLALIDASGLTDRGESILRRNIAALGLVE